MGDSMYMIGDCKCAHVVLYRTPQRVQPFGIRRPHAARRVRSQLIPCANTSESILPVTTPHSGYHFDGSSRRFFEGWYFKVTLPGSGQAFALIYSVEEPGGGGKNGGTGAQIMGPDDSYLLQYSRDVSKFWADTGSLALGATFKAKSAAPQQAVTEAEFNAAVKYGYQATQTWHQGNLVASEEGAGGNLPSTVACARWAFSVKPQLGWGSTDDKQKATAGWLASLPVFEPHWQVMMALGCATGWIEWGGKRYEFSDAPAYAEKNWGGGFPKRWFWIQCDRFEESNPFGKNVTLTSVGAIRGVLNLPNVEEDVGLVGLHWGDRFFEFVPWAGKVEWTVEPWGSWRVTAQNGTHRVLIEASCPRQGTPLRAPTADQGLSPFCRDSFFGQVRVQVWEAASSNGTEVYGEPILDASSTSAAVEVGGGPWWETWKSEAKMRQPLKSLVGLPVDVEYISSKLPERLRPKGL